MYKIIGADGKEYGPVSIAQLKQWLAQRRINPQTRIQSPGSSEWRPASEVPELADLFTSTTNPPAQGAPPLLGVAAAPSRSKGLAVASFVLGLCSIVLCLSLVAGLPAIILGHVARRRAVRSPERYGGKGLATSGVVLGYCGIFLTLLIATLFIQSQSQSVRMNRARPARRPVSDCENNLRQIGLAFKVWALDHNDVYPFNVSAQAGGSLEQCARDTNGFELNPVPHLLIISNELSTPVFLICPKDSGKHAASDFASLTVANVSYRLRTGTNINADNPQEVLAICPIHGNELYCDGNVRSKPRR